MFYAEIAVNAPVSQTFHYHIPLPLDGKLRPGHLVRVAFGTAKQPGIVLSIGPDSPVVQTKPVEARLDPDPVVTPAQITLAKWISETYVAPIGPCLWLMLPPGLTGQRDSRVSLVDAEAAPDDLLQSQVVALLKRRGTLRARQMRLSIKDDKLGDALRALSAAGTIEVEPILSPPVARPQIVQTAALEIHPTQIEDAIPYIGRKSRRADLLEAVADFTRMEADADLKTVLAAVGSTKGTLQKLADEEGMIAIDGDRVRLAIERAAVPDALISLRKAETDLHILRVLAREDGPMDVSWVYAQTGAKLADLKRLADLELITLGEKQTWRDSLAERDFMPVAAPPLTEAQQTVWADVVQSLTDPAAMKRFLLHGVTGSGKTEIYLRAIDAVLKQGKQAIFLVPEIALTAQTVRRVAARFPGKVAVVHSGLSTGERYDTWRRARAGRVSVIVGARVALFSPLPDLGLIILDESHDHSYKHSPPIGAPYYDARQVAETLSALTGAALIMGSATPDVESYYRAQRGDYRYLLLPDRIMGHRMRIEAQAEREGIAPRYRPGRADASAREALTIDLPPVEIVDMRAELKSGNRSMFSRSLHLAVAEVLKRREQAILFLNRRGASTYVFCRDCGHVEACPRCDMPLTYHSTAPRLSCHYCGYEKAQSAACPNCGSARIKYFGAGTQQVEEELSAQFPQARVVRWDADTASKPEMHDAILGRFLDRGADIMVGTQMIAKGLDLPLVTLVGVVSADTGLGMPDFRAGERTFQVLTQVAGRAGRGLLGGRVVLQTYRPEHYAIQAAAKHDYTSFYAREIAYRRDLGYPPFRRMARLLIQDSNAARARESAIATAERLREKIEAMKLSGTEIIGPAPCFFARVNRLYRWHILVRSPVPIMLLADFDLPRGWHLDIDPLDVL